MANAISENEMLCCAQHDKKNEPRQDACATIFYWSGRPSGSPLRMGVGWGVWGEGRDVYEKSLALPSKYHFPQHFLNFLPLPQVQGSLRPTFFF